jgi:hypothetical protein
MAGPGLAHRGESCDVAGRITGRENAERFESLLPADHHLPSNYVGCVDAVAIKPSRSPKYNWGHDWYFDWPSNRGRRVDGQRRSLVLDP